MLLSILLLATAQNPALPDPATPARGNPSIDVLAYRLELALAPPSTLIQALAELDIISRAHFRSIILDLNSELQVADVWLNHQPARFVHTNDHLAIKLPAPIPLGDTVTISIRYGGNLPQESESQGEAVGLLGDGIGLVSYPEPDGAHNWFPCNDHPSDKATFSIAVSVPLGNIVGATGLPRHWNIFAAWNRFHWQTELPVATYLVSLGAGPYHPIVRPGRTPILDLALPGDQTKVRENLAICTEMIPFLESIIGPYPFERYGHVFTRREVGGLECQTQTILGREAGLGGDQELLIHELGHQWFGDWVSPAQWRQLWLNEGGATYCEWLWGKSRNLKDGHRLLRSWRRSTLRLSRHQNPWPLSNPDPEELFDPALVYNKGGMVMFLLETYLGAETFHRALSDWFKDAGGGISDTNNFKLALEKSSGIDLDRFFKQWVDGTGIPDLRASMRLIRSGKQWKVKLSLRQSKNTWFPFASEVLFKDKSGKQSKRIKFRIDDARYTLETTLDFKANSFTIDPDALLPLAVASK